LVAVTFFLATTFDSFILLLLEFLLFAISFLDSVLELLLFTFLILGNVYSFAAQKTLRTVERCRVTSKGITKDGKKYANCVSLQSGKTFNFTGLVDQTYHKFSKGTVFKVYFYGNGNRNLILETFDYIQ